MSKVPGKDKKKKPKLDVELKDDKNNPLEPEAYFVYLERKAKQIAQGMETTSSPELVATIRSVMANEDKSKQGIPFSQICFTGASAPKQIVAALRLLQIYPCLQRVIFTDCVIDGDVCKEFVALVKAAPILKYFSIVKPAACSADLLVHIVNAIPYSKVKAVKLQNLGLSEQFLDAFCAMVERYISLARQKAQAMIDEDIAKDEEQKEKDAQKKKKPKKKKKAKKGSTLGKTVDQVYLQHYLLDTVVFRYCGLGPLEAPALGRFMERVGPNLVQLDLRGNSFGAIGLGEIGAGLERAGLKLFDKPVPGEFEIQRQTYVGTRWIRLQRLDLSACRIQETFAEAFGAFGAGCRYSGCLAEVNLQENACAKMFSLLNPHLEAAKQLTKVHYPLDCLSADEAQMAAAMKEHKKTQTDTAKAVKKLVKKAKKDAKLAKKQAKLLEKQAKAALKAGGAPAPPVTVEQAVQEPVGNQ